ncbi:hypothetical protein IWW55_004778 [Coemansia sp. RSA 2706]|nr:hypothetical protein IWW55_004778 [Coemansia sp. RSA 2706]KAJ2304164.1 hypothetical protein IWW54_005494 [Coemansia sp. RSA 2705]KAJ2322277.1 hypothetical protein IWW51_004244 [Coemansia sp. RSA 2702]KAJ2717880.1 hypothetical protein H4R23_005172 [Coemansia sp. Cherry 401B]
MPHDIDDVRGKNVISYDREYLEHCCPTSTCIRRSDTGAPVSWAYCHADYQIGVVLTLSEYRSRGLAKYVLQNLGDKMIQLFAEKMSLLYDTNPPAYPFKLQMVTELTNVNTQRLFARFGLKPVARVSWAECTFDSKEVSTPAAHFQPQVLVAF